MVTVVTSGIAAFRAFACGNELVTFRTEVVEIPEKEWKEGQRKPNPEIRGLLVSYFL